MRIRKKEPVDTGLNNEEILFAARVSDALAHPARIRMLRYIMAENFARRLVTNKDLVTVFDYAQATVSQHLARLAKGGLIESQKRGTSCCYFACVGRLTTFTETLKKIDSRESEGSLPDFLLNDYYDADEFVGEITLDEAPRNL